MNETIEEIKTLSHEKEFVRERERWFEILILTPEMMNGALRKKERKTNMTKLNKYTKRNQTESEVKANFPMSSHYYDKKRFLKNFTNILTLETTK